MNEYLFAPVHGGGAGSFEARPGSPHCHPPPAAHQLSEQLPHVPLSQSKMADAHPLPIGVTAIKPVERHGLEAVKWFLWDKEKGAIMGRTPLSWARITVFYIIFYSLLAGFWALMLFIFFQTIDDKEPRWVAKSSIIGTRHIEITNYEC